MEYITWYLAQSTDKLLIIRMVSVIGSSFKSLMGIGNLAPVVQFLCVVQTIFYDFQITLLYSNEINFNIVNQIQEPFVDQFFFRRFSGLALFVYRLIGATLIGIFFDDPFLKYNWNFVERGHLCTPGR